MSPETRLALKDAAKWLARKDRTLHEAAERLRGKGLPEDCVRDAIDWLSAHGFVCDARVAEDTAARLKNRRGRAAIAGILAARGVPQEEAERALGRGDGEPERQAAERLLDKRPSLRAEPAKAARFLVGRGFSEETVLQILDGLRTEDGSA